MGNSNVQLQGQFLLNSNDLQFTLTGATATGAVLQNSAPVSIPTFADFLVNGPVTTDEPNESNTINSLTFNPASSLFIYNTLTVTSGLINGNVTNNGTVNPGNSPGTLSINGDFTQTSSGTLQIEIASSSVFDRLVVSGNAALAGTLQALNYGGNKLKYDWQSEEQYPYAFDQIAPTYYESLGNITIEQAFVQTQQNEPAPECRPVGGAWISIHRH